jgi:hypothetical protein
MATEEFKQCEGYKAPISCNAFALCIGALPRVPVRTPTDTERMDWLENEGRKELTCLRTAVPITSLFRRNVVITRNAVDEAMSAWAEVTTTNKSQD